MRKGIITISGRPGSGKSSTANLVAKELGYDRFSTGDFMRKMALDRGITLADLGKLAETDSAIDTAIDTESKKLRAREGTVIDSRLAYCFIPESFKVFLDLPLTISEERIRKDLRNNKLRGLSDPLKEEEIYKKTIARLESEQKRYRELYGISDYSDKSNFDLVVDTDTHNLEQVVEIILKRYKEWQEART